MKRGESGGEHSVHSNQPTNAAKSGFTLTTSVWADEALQREAEHNKNHDKRYKNNNAVVAKNKRQQQQQQEVCFQQTSKTNTVLPNRSDAFKIKPCFYSNSRPEKKKKEKHLLQLGSFGGFRLLDESRLFPPRR